MTTRTPHAVSASELKARCLALLDKVAETQVPIVVTKRGKAIAKLVPLEGGEPPSLLGSVSYDAEEDLLAPVDETWDADS
jgi:prevent-host-death family protein